MVENFGNLEEYNFKFSVKASRALIRNGSAGNELALALAEHDFS